MQRDQRKEWQFRTWEHDKREELADKQTNKENDTLFRYSKLSLHGNSPSINGLAHALAHFSKRLDNSLHVNRYTTMT